MITTKSKETPYALQFSNGTHQALADVPPNKGGGAAGFGAHELLEASLASCINMWIRMEADRLKISVGAVAVSVVLKRDHPQEATFECKVGLSGVACEHDRATLLAAADDCPVRRTLTKKLFFHRLTDNTPST